ncbi:MAG: TolC family protein [Nitrospirae bacterium]|nr:TolC family protein [Nitrospirota bacterium]
MRAHRKILMLTVFTALILAVSAADAEVMTLRKAVEAALEENAVLKAYAWRLEGQREELKAAQGRLYPRITAEETFTKTDNPTYGFMAKLDQERIAREDLGVDTLNNPAPVTDFRTALRFDIPLYVPRTYAGIDRSGRELEAMRAEYERKKEEIVLEVIRAYLTAQAAEGHLRAARRGLEDAREHVRLAALRYEGGTGLYADLLRARVALKEAEAAVVKAESGLDTAKRAVGLLTGREGRVDVGSEKPLLPVHAPDTYIEAAADRQDLRALRLRHESALKAVSMEKASRLPEIGVGGSYQLNDGDMPLGADGRSYQVMVVARLNIFDAATSHRIRRAAAAAREVQEYYEGLEKEVRFRIYQAYSKVTEKGKRLELSRAALDEAEEAKRLVEVRYRNSLSTMADLLDTQAVLDRARAVVLEAEKEYIVSIAELYFHSGILLKSFGRAESIK